MRIRRVVNGSCENKPNYKEEALSYIRSAMECLALVPDDEVCQDSIANLGFVLVDLSDNPVDISKEAGFVPVDEVVPSEEGTTTE